MGESEARSDLAVRRDRRAGRRLVHRTVLRALLSAVDSERERDFGKLHRRHRAAVGHAVLCFLALLSDRIGRKWIIMLGLLARRAHLYCRFIKRCRPPPVQQVVTAISQTKSGNGRDQSDAANVRTNGALQAAPRSSAVHGIRRTSFKTRVAWKLILLVFVQVIWVTMVYGPIAAYLVEAFPAKIRYTALSLPYHIGNGVFGGLLPLIGLIGHRSDRQYLRRTVLSDRRRRDHFYYRLAAASRNPPRPNLARSEGMRVSQPKP